MGKIKKALHLAVIFTTITTMIAVLLMPLSVVSISANSYTPIAWVADNEWIPYTYADGTPVKDPGSDVSPVASDITSGTDRGIGNLPSIYIATKTVDNETHLFFRMRIKGDPYDRKGGFTSTAYLVQLWTADGHVATLGLDGKPTSSDYVYVANGNGSVFTKVYETSSSAVNGLTVVDGTRIVPDGNIHYFIDFQVPFSAINSVLTNNESPILSTTPIRLVYGTSQAANLSVINKETINNLDGSIASVNDFKLLSSGFSDVEAALIEPSVKITSIGGSSPESYPSFTTNNIVIAGTTSILDSVVEISLNGLSVATTASVNGNWSINMQSYIPQSSGTYFIEATIKQDGTTYSDSSLFSVNITLQSGSNLTIDGGSTVYLKQSPSLFRGTYILSNASYSIRLIVENSQGVQVIAPVNADKSNNQGSGIWTLSPNKVLANGQYTVIVEAYNNQGIYARATQILIIDPDATASSLSISFKSVNSEVINRPSFTGEVTDAQKIDIRINSNYLASITPTSFTGLSTWTLPALIDPLPSGNYTFTAIAYGVNGDIAFATTSYAVAAQSSNIVVSINSITGDEPSKPGLTGTVTNANRVEIYNGTTLIEVLTVTNSATPVTWNMDPIENPLSPGAYTFKAIAYDSYGTTTEATINYSVEQSAFSISIDNGPTLKSNDNQPSFSGTTNAPNGEIVTLTLTKDGEIITKTATVINGRWRVEFFDSISDGQYVVEVSINSNSDTLTFILDTTPPTINLVGDNEIDVYYGDNYIDLGAQAFDIQDGDISNLIVTSSFVNTKQLGTYFVYYNVTDLAGNAAEQIVRTVNVIPKPLVLIGSTGGAATATANNVIIGSTVELIASNSSVIATTVAALTTIVFNNVPYDTGYSLKMTDASLSNPILSNTADVLAADDNIAPVIVIVNDAVVPIATSSFWIAPSTTASDNIDGNLTSLISITYSSNVNSSVTNLQTARIHLAAAVGNKVTVTYSVSDSSNNTTTISATFTSIGSPINSVTISGILRYNQDLSTSLNPLTATATYQWYRSNGSDWIIIGGATSSTYKLMAEDIGTNLKVIATGTVNYSGTVEAVTTSEVTKASLPQAPQAPIETNVSTNTITIDTVIGQEYRLGDGSWFTATQASVTFENLSVNTTYTIYTRLKETDTTEASLESQRTITTLKISLVSVTITGTVKSGEILTAGNLNPSDATVTYQWQRFVIDSNSYVDIDGATSQTYTVTNSDLDTFIRVLVTGVDNYTGTVNATSTEKVPLLDGPSAPVAPNISTYSATTITIDVVEGQEYSIDGGASWSLTGVFIDLTPNTTYHVITRIKQTETTLASAPSSATPATTSKIQVTTIGVITGTLRFNSLLNAGAITPNDATVTYQWQRSSDLENWTNIHGANSVTYAIVEADINNYIKVVATGTGNYEGTVSTSRATKVLKQISNESRAFSISFKNVTSFDFEVVVTPEIENLEYSTDETTWQDSPIFLDKTQDTQYTVYVRTKETPTTESKGLGTSIVKTLALPSNTFDPHPNENLEPDNQNQTPPTPPTNPSPPNQPTPPSQSPLFTVDFVDYDNTLIETRVVNANNPVTPPALTKSRRVGHIFTGWSANLNNINANTVAVAQYSQIAADVIERRTNALIPTASGLHEVVSFTDEELLEDVAIILELELIPATVVPELDKSKIDTYVRNTRPNQNSLIKYVDITLIKKVGQNVFSVTTLPKPIKISFEVSDDFKNVPFTLVRVHEGILDNLPFDYDETTYIVTFETDRFSTYALVQSTTFSTRNPSELDSQDNENNLDQDRVVDTGQSSSLFGWLIGFGMLFVILSKKRKTNTTLS